MPSRLCICWCRIVCFIPTQPEHERCKFFQLDRFTTLPIPAPLPVVKPVFEAPFLRPWWTIAAATATAAATSASASAPSAAVVMAVVAPRAVWWWLQRGVVDELQLVAEFGVAFEEVRELWR